jgi:flagellar assembly protein FliH
MSLFESVVVKKPRAGRVRFVCSASPASVQQTSTASSGPRSTAVGGWVSFEEKAALDEAAQLQREYQRGWEEGRRAAGGEWHRMRDTWEHETRERLESVISNLRRQHHGLLVRMEQELLTFALSVAGRIVRREVRLQNDIVIGQIQEAVRRVVGTDTIKLRIHPEDEQMVRNHRGALLALSDSVRDVIIEPDPMIERGGCVIESPAGNVDARLSTQLRQIESALFGDMQHGEREER